MKKVDAYRCDHCETIKLNPDDMSEHEFMCRHNPETVQCITCVHCKEDYWGQFEEEFYSCLKDNLKSTELDDGNTHRWRRCKDYESWK